MRCKECGEKLESGARYCDFCGTPVYEKKSIYSTKGDIGHINVDENFHSSVKKKNELSKKHLKVVLVALLIPLLFMMPIILFSIISSSSRMTANAVKNVTTTISIDAMPEGSADHEVYNEAVLFHKEDGTYVRIYNMTIFLSDKKLETVSDKNAFEYDTLRDYYKSDSTNHFYNYISDQYACLLLTDGESNTLYIIKESNQIVHSIENVENFRSDFGLIHVLKEGNLFLVDTDNDFEEMNFYGGVSSFAYDGDKLFYKKGGVIYGGFGILVEDSIGDLYSVVGGYLVYNSPTGFKVIARDGTYIGTGKGNFEKTLRIKNNIYIVSTVDGKKNLYHMTKNKEELSLVDEGISKIVFFTEAAKEKKEETFDDLFDGLEDRVAYIKENEMYLAVGKFKERVVGENSILIAYRNDGSFYTYVDGEDVYEYSPETNYVGSNVKFEEYFRYADILGEQLYFLSAFAAPMKCDYNYLIMRDNKYFVVGDKKIEVYNENTQNIDTLPYTSYKFTPSDKLYFMNSDQVLFSYQDEKAMHDNISTFDILNNSVIYLSGNEMYINEELIEEEVIDYTVLSTKTNMTYFDLFKELIREK